MVFAFVATGISSQSGRFPLRVRPRRCRIVEFADGEGAVQDRFGVAGLNLAQYAQSDGRPAKIGTDFRLHRLDDSLRALQEIGPTVDRLTVVGHVLAVVGNGIRKRCLQRVVNEGEEQITLLRPLSGNVAPVRPRRCSAVTSSSAPARRCIRSEPTGIASSADRP